MKVGPYYRQQNVQAHTLVSGENYKMSGLEASIKAYQNVKMSCLLTQLVMQ